MVFIKNETACLKWLCLVHYKWKTFREYLTVHAIRSYLQIEFNAKIQKTVLHFALND